jgi:hypothetical protein
MKTISKLILMCSFLFLISCTNYTGRYEIAVYGGAYLYVYSDGSCTNGLGSLNGGLNGTWEKVDGGIQINGMGGDYNGYWEYFSNIDGFSHGGLKWVKRNK